MSQDKPKKKGRAPQWLLFVAIVAIALFLLRDCIPGFGWGGAAGNGSAPSATAASAAAPSATVTASVTASVSSAQPTSITVRGDGCGDVSCDDACAQAAAGRPVVVDASKGSHGTVETLKACLQDRGLEVSVRTN